MFKSILFVLLLLPAASAFDAPSAVASTTSACVCPEISNLSVTAQTSTSISFSWTKPEGVNQVKVWFVRQGDNFTSEYFYTSGSSFTFSNLSAGRYDFYFVSICLSGTSTGIGIQDVSIG